MSAAPAAAELRAALGRFATGVTIVTCREAPGGAPVGLTCNSFGAVSLEPPLVQWSLRLTSSSLPAFRDATHFAVNVLSESQIGLSRRFATSHRERFADGAWHDGEGGAPLLVGAAAIFECLTEARHAIGDHLMLVGRVLRCRNAALPPLLFHGGHYHLLGEIL